MEKEDQLRMLAQKAREERSMAGRRASHARSYNRSRSRSASSYSRSDSEDEEATREREQMRRERRQENEKQLRQSRMGTERRIQMLAREQNRDISEKVALGWQSLPSLQSQCGIHGFSTKRVASIRDSTKTKPTTNPCLRRKMLSAAFTGQERTWMMTTKKMEAKSMTKLPRVIDLRSWERRKRGSGCC